MADQSMRTKFGRLAFGMEYEMVIDRVEWHTRAQRMLESSGIQQLEEQVFGFLYKHSGLIKVLSLLDDLVKLLQVRTWHFEHHKCRFVAIQLYFRQLSVSRFTCNLGYAVLNGLPKRSNPAQFSSGWCVKKRSSRVHPCHLTLFMQ